MECAICMEKLDTVDRRPKALPCGHTVCLNCLKGAASLTCPHCRKVFPGPPEALPDNFFLLGLIEERCHQDQRFWCRDCGQAATEDCVDLPHSVCSLRKLRAEQAAAKLERLRSGASAARRLMQALVDTQQAVQAQLDELQARLHVVEEAERELRAAADKGRAVEAAEPAGLEQLLEEASLLQAGWGLQLRKDGADWKGEQRLGGGARTLLCPLVLHLQREGGGAEVGGPQVTADEVAFRRNECLHVKDYCTREDHGHLDEVLHDPGLSEVKKVLGMDCERRPHWCKLLLERVAPRVQRLWVRKANREHLLVIKDMPELRYLYVHNAKLGAEAPDLPRQLQDLTVVNVRRQHLESVQRMAGLRKLALEWTHAPLDVAFPPLPAGHCGVQWLCVSLRPLSTVTSLAKAHAATLQELRVLCASEGSTSWHFADLAEGLGGCGLTALRRVVLRRGEAPGFPDNKLPHREESCRRQKQAIWASLLEADGRPSRVVTVLCAECDKCPAFPPLGKFTWVDD
ncbi:uncharacterized protein LOC117643255 [Thrips palmi]|uniref:Uncharacterized protein LOC117643255 n=1 Tax=Thrips palmi TaxID=161013 RepID=A0A6P8YLE6_THRPL|nr:uncharacterized protein LOC117643255 [Thrips palmi]XP_034237902.1 uncharacterized protein LOC117643255 [Thrips palmi]XP_034237903.1 uncharacterized protein LOC117643255 [Thrips palmi]XP_034237904.1 uncharacterized protein LOC117643255 [Thrips palmi]XP_034237905.1 uncharacterized protein LOC117643255 [Thrips palmi]XP_034237906.1 uncharacterized protein LOC117643255 [Thrips palmi]XP_034237907.1 uncharacterized protein LOC117643255 [Thrips palmi]XP_034237908.1 uncharacterized protein LOC1176